MVADSIGNSVSTLLYIAITRCRRYTALIRDKHTPYNGFCCGRPLGSHALDPEHARLGVSVLTNKWGIISHHAFCESPTHDGGGH
jgi:hypothetical protein